MASLDHDEYKNLSFRAYYISSDDLIFMTALVWAIIFVLIVVLDILTSIFIRKSTDGTNYPKGQKFAIRLKS